MQNLSTLFNANGLFFKINLGDVVNFALGIITGFILLFLFLVYITTSDSRKKIYKRLESKVALEDQVVVKMIKDKQDELVRTVKLTDNAYFKVAFDLSFELASDIARYYYPKSKYPIYELSFEDLLTLNKYITKRLEQKINGRLIRRFKHNRISTIIKALNTKKAIDNSKLMKIKKKYKFQQAYTVGKAVINYANPVFWFRKLAIKPSTTLVTQEVCKYIISIFGEETHKIYSKTLFITDESAEEVNKKLDRLVSSEEEGTDDLSKED